MTTPHRRERRRWTAAAAAAAAVSQAASGAASFAIVDRAVAFSRPARSRPRTYPLFAESGASSPPSPSSSSSSTKPSIATVVDDNMSDLLDPTSGRPVLVDAFAPWCGPCKLLDKVLRKAQPRYEGKVDFCRWNVNDQENTAELKRTFLDAGHTLSKLPSLIVFREGRPVAVRPGFANEFQLDDFLERELPDVLERTFDEHGVKMVPLPEVAMMRKEEEEKEKRREEEAVSKASAPAENEKERKEVEVVAETSMIAEEKTVAEKAKEAVLGGGGATEDCTDAEECWERLERTVWQNRTVVPAMDGVLLPSRSYGRP